MEFPSNNELFWDMAISACPAVQKNKAQWEGFTAQCRKEGIQSMDVLDALRILWNNKQTALAFLPFETQSDYVRGILRKLNTEKTASLQGEINSRVFPSSFHTAHGTITLS